MGEPEHGGSDRAREAIRRIEVGETRDDSEWLSAELEKERRRRDG